MRFVQYPLNDGSASWLEFKFYIFSVVNLYILSGLTSVPSSILLLIFSDRTRSME